MLKEMLRGDPAAGSGKPEALRHDLMGFWSRRLSRKDRLVYAFDETRQRDKRLHKNFCAMLKEMLRGDPATGSGKPEALRHDLMGFWSRRLSRKDRLVYAFDETHIHVFAIGDHYDQLQPGTAALNYRKH